MLGLQSGDKESAGSWREMIKDLKRQGLDTNSVLLGTMDGLSDLNRVFIKVFTMAKLQRCQMRVACSVLAKVPKKLKKDIADQVRSTFYTASKSRLSIFLRLSRPIGKKICLQRSSG